MNVQLKDVRKTIKIELPSFPGSEVILYDGLLFGDAREFDRTKSDLEMGVLTLKKMIKDWNFTDEKGNKLEVSEENLNRLPLTDLTFLLDKVNQCINAKEKKTKKSSKS